MNPVMKYIAAHRRPCGAIGMTAAGAIAVVYFFVVPEKASTTEGIIKLFLLYGHGVCWLFIALASGLWAVRGTNRWSTGLLYAALASYVAFLISMLVIL